MSDSSSSSDLSNLSHLSDSDFATYESRSYDFLLRPTTRLRNPDGTFRCPFCIYARTKQFLPLPSLLHHASALSSPSSSSSRRKPSLRAAHRALARFLRTRFLRPPQPARDPLPAFPRKPEDLLFFPWTAVLANIPLGCPLHQTLSPFNPDSLFPLFISPESDSPCAVILRFRTNWSGFRDALCFQNRFKAEGFGREEWVKGKKRGLYGWMAKEEDFNGGGGIGEYLRRNGKLVTVSEVEDEEGRESGKMVELLAGQIAVKNRYVADMECKNNESDFALRSLMEEKNRLHTAFNQSNTVHHVHVPPLLFPFVSFHNLSAYYVLES